MKKEITIQIKRNLEGNYDLYIDGEYMGTRDTIEEVEWLETEMLKEFRYGKLDQQCRMEF